MIRVLIIDDELHLTAALRKHLSMEGMDVATASSGREALAILKNENFDVAVLDIKLPDVDGVGLLLQLKRVEPTLEVVMLTGFASVETAINSMKMGAYDYLTKPCKVSELANVIYKAHEKRMLRVKTLVLEEHMHRMRARDDFVGISKQMERVRTLISLVAESNTPVLILGETGTGKELAARAIHDLSTRAENPFVVINSSVLQETMLESELFGHKKGAFTGAESEKMGLLEIADRGTFFVDEVGDMGPSIQGKLLRALETGVFRRLGDTKEKTVDARFIFATNKDLKQAVEQDRFRKDLFFRINAFIINLPPLREKREDIPLLVNYCLDKFSKAGERKGITQNALELLMAYDWPGNVRELQHVLERAVILSHERGTIDTEDLSDGVVGSGPRTVERDEPYGFRRVLTLAEMEGDYIQRVLTSVGGNKSRAARLLGISRKNLYDRVARRGNDPGGSA
ncbi:MAG TPA: sigma-54 dependent transcriptional regulator [Syntrophorhabdales bacterium]|nr:sigma-54 dependent transcriptional regulator [Syntrophorhabdales bacterium]